MQEICYINNIIGLTTLTYAVQLVSITHNISRFSFVVQKYEKHFSCANGTILKLGKALLNLIMFEYESKCCIINYSIPSTGQSISLVRAQLVK